MKVLVIGPITDKDCILLESIQEVRRFVDSYTPEMYGKDLSVGDMSHISEEARSVLLKFIEEVVEDIVCYASRDNVSPVLQSRFDKVELNETFKVGKDGFDYFLKHMQQRERVASEPREFLMKSGDTLDTYLMYRRLPRAVMSRIGRLL